MDKGQTVMGHQIKIDIKLTLLAFLTKTFWPKIQPYFGLVAFFVKKHH